jgi:hypothetical protein
MPRSSVTGSSPIRVDLKWRSIPRPAGGGRAWHLGPGARRPSPAHAVPPGRFRSRVVLAGSRASRSIGWGSFVYRVVPALLLGALVLTLAAAPAAADEQVADEQVADEQVGETLATPVGYEQVVDLTFPFPRRPPTGVAVPPTATTTSSRVGRGDHGVDRHHGRHRDAHACGRRRHRRVDHRARLRIRRSGALDEPPAWGYAIRIDGDDGREYWYIHLGVDNGTAAERVRPRHHLRLPSSSGATHRLRGATRATPRPPIHICTSRSTTAAVTCARTGRAASTRSSACAPPSSGATTRTRQPGVRREIVAATVDPWPQRPAVVPARSSVTGTATGVQTPGWRIGDRFYLRDVQRRAMQRRRRAASGSPSDQPVVGDWNGDGSTPSAFAARDVGCFATATHRANPTTTSCSGTSPVTKAIVGDWNGDGRTTVGSDAPAASGCCATATTTARPISGTSSAAQTTPSDRR